MDVRNRMADVAKLRCNVCQDFLRMILKEGWQQELYRKAHNEVNNNTRHKDKYTAVFKKMRSSDNGVNNYTVDDMDVTLITELVVAKFADLKSIQKETRDALIELKDNRNLADHSSENEKPEELYLRGLIALCNLRDFIRTVDKKEKAIKDEKRLAYRQKYIPMIDSLKERLDEERIELIQKEKSMRRDIQKVLDSNNPSETWGNVCQLYMDRSFKVEHNNETLGNFMVRASDAGIEFAHYNAALYFMLIKKDYEEAERRLFMLYNSITELTAGDVHEILTVINYYIEDGNEITDGMRRIIEGLREREFSIEKSKNGTYALSKKKQTFS